MKRLATPRVILLLVTALILLYGVIYPNLNTVTSSLQRNGRWSLGNYVEVLSQRIALEAIATSIGVSVATVLLCAAVGIPLAFLLSATHFPDGTYLPRWLPYHLSCRRW